MPNRTSQGSSAHESGCPREKFKKSADTAVPVLLSRIENAERGGLTTAARALAKIAPEQAVSELTRRLSSSDARLRRHSADALAFFKESARSAIPALVRLLEDSDGRVRQSAAVALRDIAGEPDLVVPSLIAKLTDPEFEVRRAAAIALRSFGKRAREAVPHIICIIQENKDRFYHDLLLQALAEIDAQAARRSLRAANSAG